MQRGIPISPISTFAPKIALEFISSFLSKYLIVKQTYRMSYFWKNDGKQLLLGEKPDDRPAEVARKGFKIPELGISASEPIENFPVRLKCIREGQSVIHLRNKTFKKE